jgi:exosortase
VLREGNVIVLPNMRLGVVEACSGIRSLFSLLALAAAVALVLMPSTPRWAKLLLVASAVPIAILTNSFRVTGTGILAHWWGPEVAQGFYHDFSGWIVFMVAFVLLAGENLLLHKLSMPDSPASETAPDAL